ncbi:MAG TPA: TonB-dependent receptor [Vicinamibacterales bacterium]|nr:TonB-dependent receptor [Vicinamibacterales bacterium]
MGTRLFLVSCVAALGCLLSERVAAQPAAIVGTVRDESGGALPGVSVECRLEDRVAGQTITDERGAYALERVAPGRVHLSFVLSNFAPARREVDVVPTAGVRADVVLRLALSADVTVTGKTTFANVADAPDPAQNLVGLAQSASQGAITARQLDRRPMMRTGDVLETVPGMVISQHSGEGKANQYYVRGFNLDHGTDFATTVAGLPVNMPTHGHGQGYSDLNFLIPELVSGVQFSKGPYFAEQGDFATAGAASINLVNVLPRPLMRVEGGDQGFARAVAAASPKLAAGHVIAALEAEHNDGPWIRPDDFRKINGVLRYSRGDTVNGFAVTGLAYHATWHATDQVPQRAIDQGLIDRFGTIDPTDGGDGSRFSGSLEWQRTRNAATTKVIAYGLRSDLNLFSNFTLFLNDPAHGDQIHQSDHRFVTGATVSYRRIDRWGTRQLQNTVGVQVRNDDITSVGLAHTEARRPLDTIRQDGVLQTSGAVYGQSDISWAPWLRTLAGARVDGYRFRVDSIDGANSGVADASIASPKGGAVVGPWRGTEVYANAGFGFHSNDARGTTITRDPVTGEPTDRVTPLTRAKGSEVGVRTVVIPHLQTSLALWTLSLASELVFAGDAGTAEAGRPSRRSGIEWSNYYSLRSWLILDGDVSRSSARFTDVDPAGDRIPGSVRTVVSAGTTVDSIHNVFGSIRLRYFGPRPLIADDSVRSNATTLVNLTAGYRLTKTVRFALDVFNLLDAKDSDIDYYYTSRLPGEPAAGVADIHLHPTVPRTARLHLVVGF